MDLGNPNVVTSPPIGCLEGLCNILYASTYFAFQVLFQMHFRCDFRASRYNAYIVRAPWCPYNVRAYL
jgi:hypothetical protein